MLNISSNTGDASARMLLRIQKSTLSEVRRMASAVVLLKGGPAFVVVLAVEGIAGIDMVVYEQVKRIGDHLLCL